MFGFFFIGASDSCLDSGGCWDATDSVCRKNEENAVLLCQRDKLKSCDLNTRCNKDESCVADAALDSPVCVNSTNICSYFCGDKNCLLLESYPLQVRCE